MLSTRIIIFVTIVVVAYLYGKYINRSYDIDVVEKQIIRAWDGIAVKSENSGSFSKVTVGVNANVDLIVNGVELLNALDVTAGEGRDHGVISNLHELQEVFGYYFSAGAAAERAFMDPKLYGNIVDIATNLPSAQWYIGGNAALMAQKIRSDFTEAQVQLIGPVGSRLASILDPTIQVPEQSKSIKDEVHMILEYGAGEVWGSWKAPVATRFITSYDEANSKAAMLETFFETLVVYEPDLVILSGLHMLEGQTADIWEERLSVLEKGLATIPDHTPVHLELASMASPEFLQQILERVVSRVDSLGFNEQELLFSSYAGNHSDVDLRGTHPDVGEVTDLMLWMLKTYGRSPQNPISRLTRLHFHSIHYHSIATVRGTWSNSFTAVAAGTRVAGTQACDIKELDPELVELHVDEEGNLAIGGTLQSFDGNNPVVAWSVDNYSFVYSPVLVCIDPVKTVGLGDAISSTGLLYSNFNGLKTS